MDDTSRLYTSLDHIAQDVMGGLESDLRILYRDNPLKYFEEKHHFILPPVLDNLFRKVYNAAKMVVDGAGSSHGLDIIMCAARGSGKSLFASMLEFSLWYFLDADAINLAGSEDQATIVYNYVESYIDADPDVSKVVDKRTQSRTTKKGQSPTPELRCLTASPKQVRGKHPGARRKSPGLLIIDEAAEVPDGLMKQALPMTKEARPPFNLIVSTFHHAFGDFQDFWDNAELRGFEKISMDSFDVCEKCVDDCSKCIPEFDETYCQLVCQCYLDFTKKQEDLPKWYRFYFKEKLDETRLDLKPTGCIFPEFCDECKLKETCVASKVKVKLLGDLHKECPHCKTIIEHKAKFGRGHFPVQEIRKAWWRNDRITFEVEYMGWRPGRGIFVLDPYDVDLSIVDQTYFKLGYPVVLGIDWGAAGTTAISVVQYYPDDTLAVIDYHALNAPSDTDCYNLISTLAKKFSVTQIFADSSHVFQNTHIQNQLELNVFPVNFTTMKEAGVGAMRMKFERRQINIPERYKGSLVKDLKNWRRDAAGNIIKKDDHGPDSLLCAMINCMNESSSASSLPTGSVNQSGRHTYYNSWEKSPF